MRGRSSLALAALWIAPAMAQTPDRAPLPDEWGYRPPDGSTVATLRLEDAGMLAIALVRAGKAETLVTLKPDEGAPHAIDFSPDGTELVMDRRREGGSDLWVFKIATKTWTRLTDDGASSDPVWNGR